MLSIRNIDNCLFPNVREYISYNKEIVQVCKKSKSLILVGGIGVRIMGVELLRELGADFGYNGQMSESMVNGLKSWINGGNSLDYAGFISVFDSNNQKSSRVGYYPSEKSYSNIDINEYTQNGGVVGFRTKYGCDIGCIYCNYPVIEGKEIVCYDPIQIVDTIEKVMLKIRDTSTFFEFADSTFNHPIDHARKICVEMIERKLNLHWSAFMTPYKCTEEFLFLCKEAGCTGIDLGIDAASEKMIKNLHKNFTLDDIDCASRAAEKLNIPLCFNLLLGGPGEDADTLNETFSFLEKYPKAVVSAYSAVRIYPKTPMEAIARKEGKIKESLLYPQFYISDAIEDNLNEILEKHRKKHPEWMLRGIAKPIPESVIRRFGQNKDRPLWAEKTEGFLQRRKE